MLLMQRVMIMLFSVLSKVFVRNLKIPIGKCTYISAKKFMFATLRIWLWYRVPTRHFKNSPRHKKKLYIVGHFIKSKMPKRVNPTISFENLCIQIILIYLWILFINYILIHIYRISVMNIICILVHKIWALPIIFVFIFM